jgi:alpha-L-fucosidase 2
MVLQSSDGAVHLLPALPDALKEYGSITGLKARGGFEIINMKWKNGKVTTVSIKSNLGGNLRLRTGNQIQAKDPKNFKTAYGENSNPFYQLNEVLKPLISKESDIKTLILSQTYLYDVKTEKGKIYTFLIQ